MASSNDPIPPYGKRTGWRPRAQKDFADGGAYPEIPVAQYPYKETTISGTSNALQVRVNGEGGVDYGQIARRGHAENRIIHTSFQDLIPLRQRADVGDISLERPSEEDVEESRKKTALALERLVTGAVAAQKPKSSVMTSRAAPTYVKYTPADQMGESHAGKERLIKIVDRQKDPLEPPKHKHKKIPRGPPSPPAPSLRSPPRKLTAADQEAWKIPPSVSNWKNPKGYTIALDKRLASSGRGLEDVSINDKFAQFSEALMTADRHAREEVRQRATMQQRLAEKEKAQKEDNLRALAQKAREDRAGQRRRMSTRSSRSPSSRSRSYSVSSGASQSSDSEEEARRDREKARRERREENERQLRQSRMGQERRMQQMAREQNRDISEKVALGLAKPTQSAESMYDSRLFNQSSGFNTGFNEDQAYDKPLFAERDAINNIYRPSVNDDDGEDAGETMDKIERSNRFDVLGKAGSGKGFKGTETATEREGPVQFEKDATDPFGIDQMIKESAGAAFANGGGGGGGGGGGAVGGKRYGMTEKQDRPSKRARVDDDD